MRCRHGFTIVELLVATLLVQVGLLATVAGSAVIVRSIRDDEARWRAVQRASNRIEWLAAAACAPAAISTTYADGAREAWRVVVSEGVRDLRDSVTFGGRDGRAVTLEARAPCRSIGQ